MNDEGGRTMDATDNKQDGWQTTAPPGTDVWDAATMPERFDGVTGRRFAAFVIDFTVLFLPVLFGIFVLFIFGIVTLGLGFMLFGLVGPAVLIWVLGYYYVTVESRSGTIGMKVMDLEMRTLSGGKAYGLLGVVHAVAFYTLTSVLTPLVLAFGFFNPRGRQLHDLLTATVIVNNDTRAQAIRTARRP
jgi:uncharacterized RDD family membrane protein YckC